LQLVTYSSSDVFIQTRSAGEKKGKCWSEMNSFALFQPNSLGWDEKMTS